MSEISSTLNDNQIKNESISGEINNPGLEPKSDGQTETNKELAAHVDKCRKQTFHYSQFLELVQAVNSNDSFQQHYGIIGIRKILSGEAPPIQAVIDANLVPQLIKFMRNDKEEHLQLEAAWALTNVAAGTSQQTQTIIDLGGLNTFIHLLKSSRLEIAEHAIWALGNIAGDSATFRDIILKSGGLDPLIQIINHNTNHAILKHGIWALSNLCRGKPLPHIKLVENAIPTFCKVIQQQREMEILSDAAWALSYLTSHGQKRDLPLDLVAATLPALIRNLNGTHLTVAVPCLRSLGNMTEGDREQDLALAIPDYLPRLFELTTSRSKALRRESCWALSNITAGYQSQVDAVLKNPYYVDMIIKNACTDLPEVQREFAYILSNATKNLDTNLISQMVEQGVLDCFLHLLSSPDVKTIVVVLEGIRNILRTGNIIAKSKNCPNEFLLSLCDKKGVIKLEDLQNHPKDDIYIRAFQILEEFFELESVVEI